MKLSLTEIARACHEINRAFCQANGDDSQVAWDDAPAWQRDSAINGVALHVSNPAMLPSESHEAWLAQKTREGWAYGPLKSIEKKLHPCFMPYADLPPEQKAKDYLFKATVANFRPYLGAGETIQAGNIAAAFYEAQAKPAPVVAEENPTASATLSAGASGDQSLSATQSSAPDTSMPSATNSADAREETPPVAETAEAE